MEDDYCYLFSYKDCVKSQSSESTVEKASSFQALEPLLGKM